MIDDNDDLIEKSDFRMKIDAFKANGCRST